MDPISHHMIDNIRDRHIRESLLAFRVSYQGINSSSFPSAEILRGKYLFLEAS